MTWAAGSAWHPRALSAALLLISLLEVESYSVEVGERGPLIRRASPPGTRAASLLAPSEGVEAVGAAGVAVHAAVEPVDADELVVPLHVIRGEASDPAEVAAQEKRARCAVVVGKAMRLLDAQLQKHRGSKSVPTYVQDTVKELRSLGQSALLKDGLDRLKRSLSTVSLATALATGDVWTSADQSSLRANCDPDGVDEHLEEHNMTGKQGGEKILQGDVIEQPGSALAEAAHTGNWQDHWLYNSTHSVVRYCFAAKVSNETRAVFVEAVDHISSQVPCIVFNEVQRQEDEHSCVQFPSVLVSSWKTGCWAHLGQISGRKGTPLYGRSQRLNLGPGCDMLGEAVHQLSHALGVGHEHTRIDRDEFVNIGKENADPAHAASNFPLDSSPPPPSAYEGRPLDFLSIMMPHSRAFSANGEITLEPKLDPRLHRYLGQRMGLSELDAQRLAEHYGCGSDFQPAEPSSFLSSQMALGAGVEPSETCRDHAFTNFFIGTQSNPANCVDLVGGCESGIDGNGTMLTANGSNGQKVRSVCPSTCMRCVPEPADFGERVVNDNSTATSADAPVDVLAPFTECVDALETGFAFASGAGKSCAEMVHYCEDNDVGAQVMTACPLTCGRCELSGSGGGPFVRTTQCADLAKEAAPVFLKDGDASGSPLECASMKAMCSNHAHSEWISRKCPMTCGLCQDMDRRTAEQTAARVEAAIQAAKTTTTTTTKERRRHHIVVDTNRSNQDGEPTRGDGWKDGLKDSDLNGTRGAGDGWCSRRRRWGFCSSRRRRNDHV